MVFLSGATNSIAPKHKYYTYCSFKNIYIYINSFRWIEQATVESQPVHIQKFVLWEENSFLHSLKGFSLESSNLRVFDPNFYSHMT